MLRRLRAVNGARPESACRDIHSNCWGRLYGRSISVPIAARVGAEFRAEVVVATGGARLGLAHNRR